ncbi:YkvA family protein [Clostridium sp.]|uniref:YkvA family protein n=1 Tax=Clostridium sp. TaxID=1506 RepID=UPI00261934E1|nr:YkvA family protein [uncultured Clostridium sp.]
MTNIKLKVKSLKKEIGALYLAFKRHDVPWYSKVLILLVVGYALSPIDIIPDFIPVLGYIDDLILIPIGIAFAIRLIPKDIMNDCREQSSNIFNDGKPKNWVAGSIIIFIWFGVFVYVLTRLF